MTRFNFSANICISVMAEDKQQAMRLAWNLMHKRIDKQQWGFKNNEGAEVIDWLLKEEVLDSFEVKGESERRARERIVIDDRNAITRNERAPQRKGSLTSHEATRIVSVFSFKR